MNVMLPLSRVHPRRIALFLATCWIGIATSTAQGQAIFPGYLSLDTPTDPRSIAMGESFVAAHSPTSMMYNPAGIAGIRGASFSFSRRNLNYSDGFDSFKYITFDGTVETPFADFGLFYSRFIERELTVTTPAFPDGNGNTIELANYVLGLTAAKSLMPGLDMGLTVKTFRMVEEAESGSPPIVNSNTPFLLDLGLIYSYRGILVNGAGDFTISGGASLQNFGTDFKPRSSASNGATSSGDIQQLPRFLRCGIAFSMTAPPASTGGLVPFSFLATGEYRNFLNGPDASDRAFWGFGGEVTLFEVVTGRMGGYIQPYRSIYGDRGNPYLRIGLGITLPMERFGVDAPLVFMIDYGVIPLNTRIPLLYITNSTLDVISVGVRYDNPIF